jgi:hypothetical protein
VNGPPPPPPNFHQPDPPAEVRTVTPELRHHGVDEIVRRVYQAAHETGVADKAADLAESLAEDWQRRENLRQELEDATAQLSREANTPVLDERDGRRRSRTERHR